MTRFYPYLFRPGNYIVFIYSLCGAAVAEAVTNVMVITAVNEVVMPRWDYCPAICLGELKKRTIRLVIRYDAKPQ
jgi:hypothetical protein